MQLKYNTKTYNASIQSAIIQGNTLHFWYVTEVNVQVISSYQHNTKLGH
jgi:6,7-dimethyl-8-ribityllumazine synthase